MNLKNIDPKNYTQVEQYTDDAVSAILGASNGDNNIMIDLFRDHIISMISPDYFETFNSNQKKEKMTTTKNEWIFAFSQDGDVLPGFIRFATNKTIEEIQKNYGGDNNYGCDDGRLLVSVWYCDEYTEEHKYLGHNLVNHGASCGVYEVNDERLNFTNANTIPTVDLDVAMSKPVINDTGDYDLTW